MKTINTYINEKLKINKSKFKSGPEITLFPETKEELRKIIEEEIEVNGNECSLNHIDTSKIDDMSFLFSCKKFNGDISQWDVSNVKYMNSMFYKSKFNGDMSQWEVSKVIDMRFMFFGSKFTGKNGDISVWDVSNVNTMESMFYQSDFNENISKWEIKPSCITDSMFIDCKIKDEYKPFKNGKRL